MHIKQFVTKNFGSMLRYFCCSVLIWRKFVGTTCVAACKTSASRFWLSPIQRNLSQAASPLPGHRSRGNRLLAATNAAHTCKFPATFNRNPHDSLPDRTRRWLQKMPRFKDLPANASNRRHAGGAGGSAAGSHQGQGQGHGETPRRHGAEKEVIARWRLRTFRNGKADAPLESSRILLHLQSGACRFSPDALYPIGTIRF